MIDYKDMWCWQYEANIEAGMDEDQAAHKADEHIAEYMFERADYEAQRIKEWKQLDLFEDNDDE